MGNPIVGRTAGATIAGPPPRTSGSEPPAARAALAEAVARSASEILSARPGGDCEPVVGEALPGELAALARGVDVRSLFQHPVRVSPAMRDALGRLGRAGARLRTCEEIPDEVVVVDRRVAFLLGPAIPPGGVLIEEPALVGYLHGSLERAWSGGMPYEDAGSPGYGPAGAQVKRAILRLLACGAKDELIARRLGLSLRTCRRHISAILDNLQATSRFQAGALASRSGLLDDEGWA